MSDHRESSEESVVDSQLNHDSDELGVEVVEEEVVGGSLIRKKGIYLLPNLFTTASLFSAFYAIVAGMNSDFDKAAIAIFISMILDGLDGRVARMTNTQSKFGEQYDSLADMVAFGVAPALVAFSLNLNTLGNLGWIGTFILVVGAALRLARFNTQIGTVDSRFFVGLPSPAAAGVVAGLIWIYHIHNLADSTFAAFLMLFIVAGAGILMVSNIRYYSFKDLDLKRRVPFTAILIVVLVISVVAYDPATVLLFSFLVYALSGPLQAVLRKSGRLKVER